MGLSIQVTRGAAAELQKVKDIGLYEDGFIITKEELQKIKEGGSVLRMNCKAIGSVLTKYKK